jgi:hypothetical protein
MGIILSRRKSEEGYFKGTRFSAIPASIPFDPFLCYYPCVLTSLSPKGVLTMEWVTPQHEEIDLNCEVSSYANAEL